MDKIMGGDEGGGDAAVKRQAEGFSNPMYGLANLMGQVGYNNISLREYMKSEVSRERENFCVKKMKTDKKITMRCWQNIVLNFTILYKYHEAKERRAKKKCQKEERIL